MSEVLNLADAEKSIAVTMSKLAMLLGVWRGEGSGGFPTIESFDYTEETSFHSNGREPLVHFEQKTWVKSATETNGDPLHWESGFIRVIEDGSVEMSNAQNGGRVEVLKGQIDQQASLNGGFLLALESVLFGNDPRLVQTRRTYELRDGKLSYFVEMATGRTPELQRHLQAVLEKVT